MKKSRYLIDPKQAMVLSHGLRWKIMKLLIQQKSSYAKQLAISLKVSESKIHYHLAQLRQAGLIEFQGVRSIKQGRAKLLRPVATDFILTLLNDKSNLDESVYNKLIFPRFCTSHSFEARIIVGSSVPHGHYDAISRDGHLVGELCWYLGSHLASTVQTPVSELVITDLEYISKKSLPPKNLILIGGHITNDLTAYYNKTLKQKFNVYFTENKIVSENDEFSEPSQALIAVFRNPHHTNKWVLILAGVRSLGTKSAIYSIVNDQINIPSNKDEFIMILKGISDKKNQILGVSELLTIGLR